MDRLFLRRRITQQISDKDPLGILHGFKIGVNKQGRGWRHHATSPLLCWFWLLFLHHGLNVTLVVLDGHPFLTHGTFGVPTLVTSVGNNGVLGLALETGFDRLTLLGDHMMALTIGTVKRAVTHFAIVGGPGATHIILTVKSATGRTTFPLTGMIGPIVGVEPPFTVHAIIRTVHERGKGRAAIKMIIGFE